MNDIHYYLAFSLFLDGIGPNRFDALLSECGSAKKAYELSAKEMNEFLGHHIGDKFSEFKSNFDPVKIAEDSKQKNITIVTREDKRFPQSLKNIPDVPICLYMKGDLSSFDLNDEQHLFFGIVGTRRPTAYGQQITKKFSSELTSAGMTIVSGLAMGVDATSHQTAIDVGGKTVAFLGCGVDIIYPPQNKKLYQCIEQGNGLLISEFPPGMTVLKGLFIARNRLISGLSKGILVIEGLRDSGALITARYAATQGKDVFAPPVPLTSPLSEAPNILLKEGAKLVLSSDDILEEYRVKKNVARRVITYLSGIEKTIWEVLETEAKTSDELGLITHESVSTILSFISGMEIKGLIEKNSEGKYQIRI